MLKLNIATLVICWMAYSATAQTNKIPITKEKAQSFFNAQPVKFLENAGQMTDASGKAIPFVLFKASVSGLDLYVTEKGLTYVFTKIMKTDNDTRTPDALPGMEKTAYTWERVDMNLKNANIRKENIIKENPEQGLYHYYYAHCPDGIKNVKQYGKLTIKNIYPGIDWVLYNSDKKGFKYDFIVHPGADASQIQLLYSSLKNLNLTSDGTLELINTTGSLTENAPYSYLQENNQKVESQFTILSSEKIEEHYECVVGFNLGNTSFFNSNTLVIDPQLVWATALGGSLYEIITAIDHDLYDDVFVAGHTQSTDFPVQSANTYYQGTWTVSANNAKIFITKFNNSGIMIWSTYYGGTGSDDAYSITVDSLANIIVTGPTTSTDFPLQNSGSFFQNSFTGPNDIYILKFDNVGNRLWATYYGGSDADTPNSIKTDKHGNIFVAGTTSSGDFPLQNAGTFYQSNLTQGQSRSFIIKFDNAGNRLWATFYGDYTINAIALDKTGNLLTIGNSYGVVSTNNPGGGAYFQPFGGGSVDAFISKFDKDGNLLWGSYYGGNNLDYGMSVITDLNANIYISGITHSKNLPVVGGDNSFKDSISSNSMTETDAFIAKFNTSGALVWATYCGGPGYEEMNFSGDLAIDPCNSVYMSFESTAGASTHTACEGGYTDATPNGSFDQYLMRFSSQGVLQWASYLGGLGPDLASSLDVNNNGDLYIAGQWAVSISPSTYTFVNPGGGTFFSTGNGNRDGFIARFSGRMIADPPTFSYPAPCIGITTTLTPVLSNTFVSGGLFSASQGLQINQLTGAINITGAAAGNYTISYSYESCQCHKSDLVLNVSNCAGVLENTIDTGWLKIYGNPNNGEFMVKSSSEGALTLVNELGQIIKTLKLASATNYEATITGLAAGIYFLKEEHTKSNHKIVVIK